MPSVQQPHIQDEAISRTHTSEFKPPSADANGVETSSICEGNLNQVTLVTQPIHHPATNTSHALEVLDTINKGCSIITTERGKTIEAAIHRLHKDIKGKGVDPSERPSSSNNIVVTASSSSELAESSSSCPTHSEVGQRSQDLTQDTPPTSTVAEVVDISTQNPSINILEYPPPPLPLLPAQSDVFIAEKADYVAQAPTWVDASRYWFPRITPYRLVNLLIPAILGTAKAIATDKGSQTVPITLEWVSGIVVFLILTFAADYESESSHHHLPRYISWIFRVDCMEGLWSSLETVLGIQRVQYSSAEFTSEHSGHVVSLYRLLVTGATLTFGFTKANLAYSGLSSSMNWVDWCYGVVITSVLYFLGLYENNSVGMLRSLFVEDSSHFLSIKPKGFPLIITSICTIVVLTVQIVPGFQIKGPDEVSPIFFYQPLLLISIVVPCLVVYQWWTLISKGILLIVGSMSRVFPKRWRSLPSRIWKNIRLATPLNQNLLIVTLQISLFLFFQATCVYIIYVSFRIQKEDLMPKSLCIFTQALVSVSLFACWYFLAGGWTGQYTPEWWPFRGLKEGLHWRSITTVVVEPIEPNAQKLLGYRISNKKFLFLDIFSVMLHFTLILGWIAWFAILIVFMILFETKDGLVLKLPAVLLLVFALFFICWLIVTQLLPDFLLRLILTFSLSDRFNWSFLTLFEVAFYPNAVFSFNSAEIIVSR